jgi:ribonuclease HI
VRLKKIKEFNIRRQNIQVEFRWVPGHAGIEGNETADQFAKMRQNHRMKKSYRQRRIDVDL